VLEVLWLAFTEGYAVTSGEHWIRPLLRDEELRPGRVLAQPCLASPKSTGSSR
jgi:predicted RNA polymerase sigma factor